MCVEGGAWGRKKDVSERENDRWGEIRRATLEKCGGTQRYKEGGGFRAENKVEEEEG